MVRNAMIAAQFALLIAVVPPQAIAAPALTSPLIPPMGEASPIEQVAGRDYPYKWYYTGPRLNYRQKPFVYYFGGWWYPEPWWHGPGEAYRVHGDKYRGYWTDYEWAEGDYTVGTDEHVEWCLDHYRSYNPGTDSYIGHDGERHPCHSPYD